jgi:glycine betaine/proline transport system substrate-binding protein
MLALFVTLPLGSAAARAGAAGDPADCSPVRLADVGWTDVTATTAVFAELLRQLGYESQITVLSVPVTFASMRNRDIDVFLGNWMPAQIADRTPFEADKSIEVVGKNLDGARYTLAVPDYTHAAGLRDFADIRKFAKDLNNRIYGIEPGNDGNRLVLELIKTNKFDLGRFQLIESSEQGMLAEVERATRDRRHIVFLGWDPHPMNARFKMEYLTGGDDSFGPNFGAASVYTNVRAGYLQQCPNVAQLLRNLRFTTVDETELMAGILDRKEPPQVAAASWLKAHPDKARVWLNGVTRRDGSMVAIGASETSAVDEARGFEGWIASHKLPVGDRMTSAIEFVKTHGRGFFSAISLVIGGAVESLTKFLLAIPALAVLIVLTGIALVLRRSWPLALFVSAALLFIMNQGYWDATLETLALVAIATIVSTLIGIPVGIAAAHRPRLNDFLRPVLDLMQTLPTFVYLIPTLVLFGLGVVPGLISTVIFALPAPIRLTQLGISSVPIALREAGEAFGATKWQLLWKVELPSARKSILAGITQCIMLSLSMVVIAALVGAGGLGVPVVRALNSVQVGMGFEAGFAIVLLAIVLDRMTRPAEDR